MKRRLWLKFLILLLIIGGVALSGTVILRYLMLGDFRAYLEGETEDRIYGIIANFEATYEQQSGWKGGGQIRDALWALTLGFEIRLSDEEGNIVVDSEKMLREASPSIVGRLKVISQLKAAAGHGQFIPYPLFLKGRQIGTLDVKELRPVREDLLVRRSDNFLLWCIAVVGGAAVLLSLFFSERLTRPIRDLAFAASDISHGNLQRQVQTSRRDEVGDLAKAFNRMAQTLKTQESLRRKLIADVAHELRTPLGVMRGELEGLMDGVIPNNVGHIQSLHEETGRLKQIVDAIEDLNQAEASKLSLRLQTVALKPFLDGIIDRFLPLFHEKKVSLELHCEERAEVAADPERLSQVVLNLLSNSLKATGEGGRVLVSARRSSSHEWAITVEDDGRGIGEEDLPYIFERFYHGPGGGLGIGLTIVKELVEAHGGRVEAKSAYGKGSSFAFFLPAVIVHNSS
jgi:two-component system sensor histidine kinase BaeS